MTRRVAGKFSDWRIEVNHARGVKCIRCLRYYDDVQAPLCSRCCCVMYDAGYRFSFPEAAWVERDGKTGEWGPRVPHEP